MYLQMVRLLQVSSAAEFGGRGFFLADKRGWVLGVGGIAQQIEDGGRGFVFRGEGDLLVAAADVEDVEIVEFVALALDRDDAGAADVERAQFAALSEVRRAEIGIGGQREGASSGSGESDDCAIEIDVIEMELAGLVERVEQKCFAKLVGVHARVAHGVSHQNGLHECIF